MTNSSLVANTPARRFPPPWSVEELDACFVVIDSTGQNTSISRMNRAGGRRRNCSPKTKRDGLRQPSRSLPSLLRQ